MIISAARVDDLDAVLALEESGFAVGERWSRESWTAELEHPDRLVLVRHDARGQVIGVATFSLVEDMSDLLRVVVAPDSRGRGIGGSLVRAGMDWAKAVGARRMLLEVRPDNAPAVRTYQKLGFTALNRRRDYYGTGVDALVMAVRL
ncbi:MAG: ribosomal protein S18-alanine N-acetyltransferase [Propionicimonas sp.]|nr:ribosomal protein S18-alanine N-acetyltransferase [Propionicimonas sp.]